MSDELEPAAGPLGARYIVRQYKDGETWLRTDDLAEATAEAQRISAWANSPGVARVFDTLTGTTERYREGQVQS